MRVESRPDGNAPAWLVWVALWIVYIIWGSTYLAIRVTVETLPPLFSAGIRFLIAGAIVYIWLRIRKGAAAVRVTRDEILACAFVGTALLLGGNGLVSIAERDVPSGLASLVIGSVPLWVVLLRTLFADRASKGTLIGVAVGFVGLAVLVLPGERPDEAPLFGMLLLLVAAASWAAGSFFSKRLPLPKDPFVSTAVQQLCGGLALIVGGLVHGEASDVRVEDFSAASIWALVYLVVMGSLVAFTAYVWLLQHAPISKVATYAYVNPVIAIFLGWLILSEEITTTIIVGAAIIVASVAFIVRKESVPAAKEDGVEPAPPAFVSADA